MYSKNCGCQWLPGTLGTAIPDDTYIPLLKLRKSIFLLNCSEFDQKYISLIQNLFEPTKNQILSLRWQKNEFVIFQSEMILTLGLRWFVQVNNYEIVVNFFHISHNLAWYSAIVHKFTRIYPVCSTYELTKQFM